MRQSSDTDTFSEKGVSQENGGLRKLLGMESIVTELLNSKTRMERE
jgi:hypothetical protein